MKLFKVARGTGCFWTELDSRNHRLEWLFDFPQWIHRGQVRLVSIIKVAVVGLISASRLELASSMFLEVLALLAELACLLLCSRNEELLTNTFIEVLLDDSKVAFHGMLTLI